MTTVLIADDQALVRGGFRLMLELAGLEVVGEAADGAEALELARRLTPDVVLMDVRMPNMDGIEATRRIGLAGLPTKVLVLTTFDLDEHVYEALRAGASGFLLKDADRARLVEAVEAVARGESLVAPTVLERLVTHYVERPPTGLTSPTSWRPCRPASSRCSSWWAAASPTARSPRSSSSRSRRSRRTSATCCRS